MVAHGKVDRQLVKEVERDRDRLDVAVLLVLVADDRLEEDDALVLVREHLHERLHEVLRTRDRHCISVPASIGKAAAECKPNSDAP